MFLYFTGWPFLSYLNCLNLFWIFPNPHRVKITHIGPNIYIHFVKSQDLCTHFLFWDICCIVISPQKTTSSKKSVKAQIYHDIHAHDESVQTSDHNSTFHFTACQCPHTWVCAFCPFRKSQNLERNIKNLDKDEGWCVKQGNSRLWQWTELLLVFIVYRHWLLFHSFSLQSLYLTVSGGVLMFLSNLTLTYESFKHEKGTWLRQRQAT